MKYCNIILIVFVCLNLTLSAQKQTKPVYVIVHGAWGGGWAFKGIDTRLTAKNNIVYRPTLTGQGERVHLATKAVGLDTHINDIVNTILFEELYNVILIGHSYGGMVVTGVADKIPERISKLIYVDAFVPEHNESVVTISKNLRTIESENGFLIPPWVPEGKLPPKDVPHALKTLTDTIVLNNPKRLDLETSYILTVEKGKNASQDDFSYQAERAKQKGWPVLLLESDHNPQWSAPEAFVDMLFEIVNKK